MLLLGSVSLPITITPPWLFRGALVATLVALVFSSYQWRMSSIHQRSLELEHQVAERTAQLETANKELEAFAYSVSHDLRAPLHHIDGFLELLQKRTKTIVDEKSQHYMNVIAESTRQMETLIDDILSFSRISLNEMSKTQADLDKLVKDVIREFKPEAEGRDVHWQISPLPSVTGDRALLRVVFVNLLSNALKFTQSREVAEIEIGFTSQPNNTIIFVRDNGAGFDMQYADKLLGVFQCLHRADEFEGTGIAWQMSAWSSINMEAVCGQKGKSITAQRFIFRCQQQGRMKDETVQTNPPRRR